MLQTFLRQTFITMSTIRLKSVVVIADPLGRQSPSAKIFAETAPPRIRQDWNID